MNHTSWLKDLKVHLFSLDNDEGIQKWKQFKKEMRIYSTKNDTEIYHRLEPVDSYGRMCLRDIEIRKIKYLVTLEKPGSNLVAYLIVLSDPENVIYRHDIPQDSHGIVFGLGLDSSIIQSTYTQQVDSEGVVYTTKSTVDTQDALMRQCLSALPVNMKLIMQVKDSKFRSSWEKIGFKCQTHILGSDERLPNYGGQSPLKFIDCFYETK